MLSLQTVSLINPYLVPPPIAYPSCFTLLFPDQGWVLKSTSQGGFNLLLKLFLTRAEVTRKPNEALVPRLAVGKSTEVSFKNAGA